MADLYETNLWGKIDYLHERYQREHNHINNFLNMITKFQTACSDFSKAMTSIINKNYILSESNTSTIYKSMENFYKTLLIHAESFKETSESIKINIAPVIKSIKDSFQKEKDLYNAYIKINFNYINCLNNLKKIKKEFAQKARDCENKVYEAKKASMFPTLPPEQISKIEQQASEALANTAIYEDKYVQILNEANKIREIEIALQKKLQSYYHNVDIDYYGKEKMMTGFFISCLKRMYKVIDDELIDLNENYKNINIEKDINEFIKINKVNNKPDEIIKFIPYKPATEISDESILNSDTTNNKNKDNKNLEVSLEVILVFKKLFKFIRTDLNMEKERKKSKLRNLALKIFWPGQNNYLEPKEKNALFNLFKEKNFTSYFLTIVSRQRTKGFKITEKLMNDLTEMFIKILEISEQEKNYDVSINCVILSQTFFCEKKEKNGEIIKNYIIDGIRDNKWLSSYEFWDGVINYMIEKEIKKNEEINKDKNEKEKKNNDKNIAFSQIFSHTNNMIEFNINKNDIHSFIENLCNKYELDSDMINSIKNNINKKLEDIELLLSKEKKVGLKDEIKKEEIKVSKKEDVKEEKKEDKDEIKKEVLKEDKKKEEISKNKKNGLIKEIKEKNEIENNIIKNNNENEKIKMDENFDDEIKENKEENNSQNNKDTKTESISEDRNSNK